jgi:NAD dependent epimerase/dehydratase family enzyme
MMKILFGRMSEILLNGSRVSAEKVRSAGYIFLYPKLENALVEITQKSKNNTSNKKEVV